MGVKIQAGKVVKNAEGQGVRGGGSLCSTKVDRTVPKNYIVNSVNNFVLNCFFANACR
jgi:hypothetical protein